MTLRVTLIQGGGSGLDQVPAVQDIVSAAGVALDWDTHLAGWASEQRGAAGADAALRARDWPGPEDQVAAGPLRPGGEAGQQLQRPAALGAGAVRHRPPAQEPARPAGPLHRRGHAGDP